MSMPLLDDDRAQRVIEKADSPVFMLFVTADGRGKAARKVVESLIEHYDDRVIFIAVQAEENPGFASTWVLPSVLQEGPAAVISRRGEAVAALDHLDLADRERVAKAVQSSLVVKRREDRA